MKTSRGFTLIELMIVVAIVAILAAIAYPSYEEYIIRNRRAQGKSDMMQLAQRLERVYTTDRAYTAATTICDKDLSSPVTGTAFYTLATECTATTYTIKATPQGPQAKDTRCNVMTLNQLGAKTASGSLGAAGCW